VQHINLFKEINQETLSSYSSSLHRVLTWVVGMQDNLASGAVRFLTAVAKSMHHELFGMACSG
jgi:hypothetical protein